MGRDNNITRGWALPEKLGYYSRYNDATGCLEWQASLDTHGYGHMYWKGRIRLSHRLAWEWANGPVPEGKSVCHRCDNPRCLNTAHMFIGTHTENMADKKAKGRQSRLPGEKHGAAKLTEHAVRAIRSDIRKHRVIAEAFGVSPTLIFNVKRGLAWRHVQ